MDCGVAVFTMRVYVPPLLRIDLISAFTKLYSFIFIYLLRDADPSAARRIGRHESMFSLAR